MKKTHSKPHKPSAIQNTKTGPDTVYLMKRPKGGFINDLIVRTENGPIIYHVKSKTVTLASRSYSIYDRLRNEVYRTKQEHTAIFPRHTIIQDEKGVASVGQSGLIPQNYFIQIGKGKRFIMHISGFKTVYELKDDKGHVMAEIAQHRATWIVVVTATKNRELILASIAVVCRLNTSL